MKEALAVVYREHGKPLEVLDLERRGVATPGPGEVLLALRCAVIHPSDMGMIGGSYGRLKSLPAVAGREGVGEIVALGEGVDTSLLGRRARMPEEPGAWVEAVCTSADSLTLFPEGLKDEFAAQAYVNPPTALRLLSDFVELKAGDWIVQNAANSAVGFCVAGLAKHRGLNTLCVVRDRDAWEEPLKQAGASVVVAEESGYEKQIEAIVDGERPKLGLNSIGGDSVMRLIKSLGEGGTVVTFGGMVGDKVRYPTRELIFKDLCLRGFWMDRWFRQHTAEARKALMADVCSLLGQGLMPMPVDSRYAMTEAMEAVKKSLAPGRRGKVLLTSDWQPT